MSRYRVTISGPNEEAMADLVRKHSIRVFDHGLKVRAGKTTVQAVADDDEIGLLQTNGYTVERHEDVDLEGQARQQEVGVGNRYEIRDNTQTPK